MKDNSISFIRLLSMIMIISCHILQGLDNKYAFWINVGVQIFLFISGFLYGNKKIDNISEFYKKRIMKILFPFSLFSICICLIEYFVLKNKYSIKFVIGNAFGLGGFIGTYSIISHTWFVSYILLCYLITPLLQKIFNDNFKKNILKFILICIFIQSLESYSIININACWVINFILGYFYSLCYHNPANRKRISLIIFLGFIIIFPFAIIYQEALSLSLPDILNRYSNYFINYGHVLLGSVIFIILYNICTKYNIKENNLFYLSDQYSYYIYLVHQIFILNSFSVLLYTQYLIVNVFLIFLLSIIGAIMLKFLCDLIFKKKQ